MKTFVTFCVQDSEAGANPLGHSLLLFSQFDEHSDNRWLKVVDAFGFYGLPSTRSKNSLIRKLKISVGLDTNFSGNHGMLRHEEWRYLDLGKGLRGVTFELTAEQFQQLLSNCNTMISEQQQAIDEVVQSQGIEPAPKGQYRIYPHEHLGPIIYQLEQIKAQQKGLESRVKPFNARFRFGWTGPDISKSHNCKSQAIELLSTVLTAQQIDRLTEKGKHPTIPIYSGRMESIHLFSTGKLHVFQKSSGEMVHYRRADDIALWFTIPPQECEFIAEDTKALFTLDKIYCQQAKSAVRKLQKLEWFLLSAQVSEKSEAMKKSLLAEVTQSYQDFACIRPLNRDPKNTLVPSTVLAFFKIPNTDLQISLQSKLQKVTSLFNTLSSAIADESCDGEGADGGLSYLSMVDQQKICKIIGQTYVQPKSWEASTFEKECRIIVEPLITKLQRLKWCLDNAAASEAHQYNKRMLIAQVESYKNTMEKYLVEIQDRSAFHQAYKDELNKFLENARCYASLTNTFFDRLAFAIADGWSYDDEIETIAANLLERDQIIICNIIGRSYSKTIREPSILEPEGRSALSM